MTLKERKDQFLLRATKQHGNKFDYSKGEYVDAKTKMLMVCPAHGEFYQKPDKHLAKKARGCVACWGEIRKTLKRPKMKSRPCTSSDDFVRRSRKKFGEKFAFNLTDYKGLTNNQIGIICPTHGEIKNKPINHLISGTGCPQCGESKKHETKTSSYEEVVEELKIIHNNEYEYPDYNKSTYKNRRSKIDIICKKHGKFEKKTQKHLSGQACFPCRIEELIEQNILVGGYSEELFENKPELKNEPAILYYLKINNGELYKIGITRKSVKARIRGIKCKSKKEIGSVEILKEKHLTLYEAFLIEQKILQLNGKKRVMNRWSTELFSDNIWQNIESFF